MTTSEEQFHEELVAMVSQGQRDDGSVTWRKFCAAKLRKDGQLPLLVVEEYIRDDIYTADSFKEKMVDPLRKPPPITKEV